MGSHLGGLTQNAYLSYYMPAGYTVNRAVLVLMSALKCTVAQQLFQ